MEARDELIKLGHNAFITKLATPFVGKTSEEKEVIKLHQKNNMDAIREFWRLMQGADAVLVMNIDKHGIKNYIGGNTPDGNRFCPRSGPKSIPLPPCP